MPWGKRKTFRTFYIFFFLSIVFMVAHIALTSYVFSEELDLSFDSSFVYMLATTYGTGFGCLWFRLRHSMRTFQHAIIHTVVLILMIFGYRELPQLISDDKNEAMRSYGLSMITICVYILQYLLSFYLAVFRCGRSNNQRAFCLELHAFSGALTFFLCVMDGYMVHCEMVGTAGAPYETLVWSGFCLLFYGFFTWYIMLNPFFNWRWLHILIRPTPIMSHSGAMSFRYPSEASSRSPRRSKSPRRVSFQGIRNESKRPGI